jgi:hypothetical protein
MIAQKARMVKRKTKGWGAFPQKIFLVVSGGYRDRPVTAVWIKQQARFLFGFAGGGQGTNSRIMPLEAAAQTLPPRGVASVTWLATAR